MNYKLRDEESARISCTLNNTATAIFIMTPELEIAYLNTASANFLKEYTKAFSSIYPGMNPEHVVGMNLEEMGIIPDDKIARLKDPEKLPYAKFVDVGDEKFHVTINPLFDDGGKFIGSAGEWWWATEYLNSQEDTQKVTEMNGAIEVIDNITFQSDILSMNAAVEAANAGKHGQAFGIIAKEMRELAQNTRTVMKELKSSMSG